MRGDLQEAANQVLRSGLIDYDQRHGWRGPEARFPGLDNAAWLAKLAEQRTLGGLEPAIVSRVERDGIRVLTRGGAEEAVAWQSMKWQRPHLATEQPRPRAAEACRCGAERRPGAVDSVLQLLVEP